MAIHKKALDSRQHVHDVSRQILLRDAYPPSRGRNHGFSLSVVTNKYFQGRWLIC